MRVSLTTDSGGRLPIPYQAGGEAVATFRSVDAGTQQLSPQASTRMGGDARVKAWAELPTYEVFAREHLRANRPAVLSRALVSDWPSFARWTTYLADGSGAADWDALARDYGDHEVPVVFGGARETMRVRDAVALIERREEPVYIKDWHLVRNARADVLSPHDGTDRRRQLPYRTPPLVADDWMNNVFADYKPPEAPCAFYMDARLLQDDRAYEPDDFRFCYAGTAGSSTPLHRDVYTSYSWSTNVVGRKRWSLFPPQVAACLRRACPAYVRADRCRLPSRAALRDRPEYRGHGGALGKWASRACQARQRRLATLGRSPLRDAHGRPGAGRNALRAFELVPRGREPDRLHQRALRGTLGAHAQINHNWCNAYNLLSMYDAMENEVRTARARSDDRPTTSPTRSTTCARCSARTALRIRGSRSLPRPSRTS